MDDDQVHELPAARSVPAAQPLLPFDDEADQPVAFALTARARRAVAPASLPALTVVTDAPADGAVARVPTPDDDPYDTRPARARALRRAGLSPRAIAARLPADELLVRAWVGESLAAVPRPTARADDTTAAAHRAADSRRRTAADEAADRLRRDPPFASGLGLLAAISESDPHALTIAGTRAELVARGLDWLRDHAEVDAGRIRVVVRASHGTAADTVRHHWATRLRVEAHRVTVVRWPAAPAPDAVEVLVRVHDPRLAARVGGWCDAFLTPTTPTVTDLAF
ncbi:hypothetical protein [Egicoccus sp. AB-alg6-2]|uniref:hypothetical protein n=1 Tax=Egicoccus sp. AB-alg6-2 TaxID=3242692 RepID=UPI00359D6CD1